MGSAATVDVLPPPPITVVAVVVDSLEAGPDVGACARGRATSNSNRKERR